MDTLSNAEMTLHSQIMALESVNMNREVFSAMKDGKDAMNRAVVNMGGPDAVEELIDEVIKGRLDFERCLATPEMLPVLARAARVLPCTNAFV